MSTKDVMVMASYSADTQNKENVVPTVEEILKIWSDRAKPLRKRSKSRSNSKTPTRREGRRRRSESCPPSNSDSIPISPALLPQNIRSELPGVKAAAVVVSEEACPTTPPLKSVGPLCQQQLHYSSVEDVDSTEKVEPLVAGLSFFGFQVAPLVVDVLRRARATADSINSTTALCASFVVIGALAIDRRRSSLAATTDGYRRGYDEGVRMTMYLLGYGVGGAPPPNNE